jgi:hypothetical protein
MCVFSRIPDPGYAAAPSTNTPRTVSIGALPSVPTILCNQSITAQSKLRRI